MFSKYMYYFYNCITKRGFLEDEKRSSPCGVFSHRITNFLHPFFIAPYLSIYLSLCHHLSISPISLSSLSFRFSFELYLPFSLFFLLFFYRLCFVFSIARNVLSLYRSFFHVFFMDHVFLFLSIARKFFLPIAIFF
jgi:hypothetical protein